MTDDNRHGRVEVYRDTTEEPPSIWATCTLYDGERTEILCHADTYLNVDNIPHGTEIGDVTINNGKVSFRPRDAVMTDYGWER